MIVLSTFGSFLGKRLQTLNVFIIMITFLSMHTSVRPFKRNSLNNLETVSIVTLSLNIYVGLLYVSESDLEDEEDINRDQFQLSSSDRVFLIIIFYSSNLIFMILFFILFLKELRKTLRLKYPKVYQFFLCKVSSKINRQCI